MEAPLTYCSKTDGAILRGKEAEAQHIQDWWLLAVDELIENYTGQGYKGAERTTVVGGMGNRLISLPSRAAQLYEVKEAERIMDAAEYELDRRGRLVSRKSTFAYTPYARGLWLRDVDYTVRYQEPGIEHLPAVYQLVAADCVSKILMWCKKNKEFDLAVTASDGASAGKVANQSATSFPTDLLTIINRTIRESKIKDRL